MRVFRRVCALGVSGLVIGGLLTGVAVSAASSVPAAADTPEAFAGTASAHALLLKLFGASLTVGATNVAADSSPKAHADGAGLALIAATVSNADANGANQSQAPPKACGLNLPVANLLTLSLACSLSASSTTNAAPTAVSGANIAALDVGALNLVLQLLQPILNALTPVLDQVIGSVTQILQPVLGPILNQLLPGLGLNLQSPVSSLVDALKRATNLATIHVGDSVAAVTTSAGAVVADSQARGAEVDVLPGLSLVSSAPLISIIVGHAHTTSTFNRTTGASAASFDPAILTVKLLGTTIPIKLGTPLTLFAGTVLESTISLGAGSTKTNADGSVSAVADGVSLDLLKGLNGGISLHLAHAESAVGGRQAQVIPTTTTSTTKAPVTQSTGGTLGVQLATTGTSAPVLPIGVALILAGFLSRMWVRTRRSQRTPRTPR